MRSRFNLFMQDAKGLIWRGFASTLDEAMADAQTLANKHGYECFVWKGSEVFRCAPEKKEEPRSH